MPSFDEAAKSFYKAHGRWPKGYTPPAQRRLKETQVTEGQRTFDANRTLRGQLIDQGADSNLVDAAGPLNYMKMTAPKTDLEILQEKEKALRATESFKDASSLSRYVEGTADTRDSHRVERKGLIQEDPVDVERQRREKERITGIKEKKSKDKAAASAYRTLYKETVSGIKDISEDLPGGVLAELKIKRMIQEIEKIYGAHPNDREFKIPAVMRSKYPILDNEFVREAVQDLMNNRPGVQAPAAGGAVIVPWKN